MPIMALAEEGSDNPSEPSIVGIDAHHHHHHSHHGHTAGYGRLPSSGGGSLAKSSFHPILGSAMPGRPAAESLPSFPPSPSVSDSTLGSPCSFSSVNSSLVSGTGSRRTDDIEELELEPELETVSELDEETSSQCSLNNDSDSEQASITSFDADSSGSCSAGSAGHASPSGSGNGNANRSNTEPHKRLVGKSKEWPLVYTRLTPRRRETRTSRRKGRIAEIVEDGCDISRTVMPNPSVPEFSFELSGPPALPPRSVSPSDTVPAVPSPLCECIDLAATVTPTKPAAQTAEPDAQQRPPPDDSVETVVPLSKRPWSPPADSSLEHSEPPPSSPNLLASSETDTAPPSEASTPPSSPQTKSRRSSSPTKLRPCFRRRPSSRRDSSCERGRSVRFSPGPPQEMRTHSPVEYDRKSCPISNRLSPEDVEELRQMRMEMGLLEARCALSAATANATGTAATHHPLDSPTFSPKTGSVSAPVGSGASSPHYDRHVSSYRTDRGYLGAGYSGAGPSLHHTNFPCPSPDQLRRSSDDVSARGRTLPAPLHAVQSVHRQHPGPGPGAGPSGYLTPPSSASLAGHPGLGPRQSRNKAPIHTPLASNPAIARFGLAPPPPLPGTGTAPRASSAPPASRTLPERGPAPGVDGPSAVAMRTDKGMGVGARDECDSSSSSYPSIPPSPSPSPSTSTSASNPSLRPPSISESNPAPTSHPTSNLASTSADPSSEPSPGPSPTPSPNLSSSSYPTFGGGNGGYDSPCGEFDGYGSEYDLVC